MTRAAAPKVLVVDDEAQTRQFLRIGLEHLDFEVVDAASGENGLGLCAVEEPDIVVLDLNLPDMNGLEVLKRLREWSGVPVIVLSAEDGDKTIVDALDRGADDYVTKPFKMSVFMARLRANLRKNSGLNDEQRDSAVMTSGDLTIDHASHECRLRGELVDLTPKEFELLSLLMKHEGKVLTHRFLLENVWGPANAEDREYLRVFIKQIRVKIEDDSTRPKRILTEMGVGYRLAESHDDAT